MDIFITIMIIGIMIFLLAKDIYDPLKIFIVVCSIFLMLGYLSIDELVQGFSNKGVLSIATFFIIAGSIEKTYYFEKYTRFDGLSKDNFKPLTLFLTVTSLSAFMNNTPIVSMFISISNKISIKTGLKVSKLLIPISYLSILGGLLTVVGTSTNLVISGIIEDMGMEPLGFFEITKISIFVVIVGFIYILLFFQKRLPDNESIVQEIDKNSNEYFVRFVVKKNSTIINKSVKDAKLRDLMGVYLVEIERNDKKIFPVTPNEIIKEEDILIFVGQTSNVNELKCIDKLVLETDYKFNTDYFNGNDISMMEVLVVKDLDNIKYTIKEMNFRSKYNAVIIGVLRNGQKLNSKIGSIKPKTGDILLLLTRNEDIETINMNKSFLILNQNKIEKVKNPNISDIIPFFVLFNTILLNLIFDIDILFSSIIGLSILLITNTTIIDDMLRYIDYKTIIIISISLSISKVITNTGASVFFANLMEPIIMNINPFLMLIAIFVITNFLTNIITNNAAATLVIPIVYNIVSLTEYNLRPFILLIAIASSTAFLSPYGYQTNTMVYSVGNYKFKDFVHFGYPLTIIIMIVTCIVSYMYLN